MLLRQPFPAFFSARATSARVGLIEGSSYIAIQDTAGTEIPTDTAYWGIVVQPVSTGKFVYEFAGFSTTQVPGTVLQRFLEYKEAGGEPNIPGFVEWQMELHNYTENTAQAYSYPLGPAQCNFIEFDLPRLCEITNNPGGFEAGVVLSGLVSDNINDAPTVLRCAFVVGLSNQAGMTPINFREQAIDRLWAGSDNAANAIRSVGTAVLNHFSLVDEQGMPNGRFSLLFCG